ncbi:hypothetical protein [Zobellia sp. 1_MG-2023]|uniref:hypothetical protein n=1 Tax=Zobellia sp. 1_MG-2023 TaxID=3062626 RepID=UPI0026E31C62|nr:hypothetical protein [Zobellia sp. 1_MG-2023]MDO6818886.1 hypothetical protein [Zobellia sp. 1_MG-2023]
MIEPSKITHPLKYRTGTSQRTRIIAALEPEFAPIDGSTLADRLVLICGYARYINFYEYRKDTTETEYQEVSDWASFFTNSLPFQLAHLSRLSTDDLEQQFMLLHAELIANPSKQTLESLLDFVYNALIVPTDNLYTTVIEASNSFSVPLLAIIRSSFFEGLKCYIALYNASANFLCVPKKNFMHYLEQPWQLSVAEAYALDSCVQKVEGGKKEAFALVAKQIFGLFYPMLNGLQEIVDQAPNFIEESLRPFEESLQKKHHPHLALLFTFLELFKHFQGDINALGKKHLDFFYEQVLKMVPKSAVPDKAHIVFEVAKHLEAYPLPKDLLLKDGKDDNKQDIQFGLDHEIVIDKAQVADLRTLALHTVTDGDKKYTEGVYIAPAANSMDGMGKKFKEGQANNWPTLGSKYSEYIQEGYLAADEHPKARLGFVLASPVLLLQEGQRTITILLDCSIKNNEGLLQAAEINALLLEIKAKLNIDAEKTSFCINNQILEECDLSQKAKTYISNLLLFRNPYELGENELDTFFATKDPISCKQIFDDSDRESLEGCFTNYEATTKTSKNALFKLWFSGEKEWISAVPTVHIHLPPTEGETPSGEIQFELNVVLGPEVPSIVFYDKENLKEEFDLKDTFPLVKIELNEEIKIDCGETSNIIDPCYLKKRFEIDKLLISPYHFLKHLQLVNAQIDVKVCGVKNLIVQNDEGALDINSQLYPFGIRPEVPGFDPMNQANLSIPVDSITNPELFLGPSFYIGSKEILYKKWGSIRVNMEWKEKPASFHDHYKAYLKEGTPEGTPQAIEHFGLDEELFKLKIEELEDGLWKSNDEILLFSKTNTGFGNLPCLEEDISNYGWEIENKHLIQYVDYNEPLESFKKSLNGFLKFTLKDQDFLHKEYPFVLARQMLAYAYMSEGKVLTDAIYYKDSNKTIISPVKDILESLGLLPDLTALISDINGTLDDIIGAIDAIESYVENELTGAAATTAVSRLNDVRSLINIAKTAAADPASVFADLFNVIGNLPAPDAITQIITIINDLTPEFDIAGTPLLALAEGLKISFNGFVDVLDSSNILKILDEDALQALIPKEPWTPIIKNLYLDYTAKAIKEDIAIVHLYPFENTSKGEDIEQNPTLLPYFDDEGTLFIGIDQLTPGGSLSLLFQLAEATADSEQDRAKIKWHYLTNNNWVALRPEFDVLSDETDGFTVSGIVSIAVPDAISKLGNTIMPDNLYWIKVSAAENVRAVAETIGVHTQAAKASARLNSLHDTNRLETALEAGSIAKLVEGDFSVKKVEQLYDAFEGRKPEAEGHFYTRVSEHLKHKGRACMITDYEKIVLEGFIEIYKAKCISHTMGLSANKYRRDLEIAPGFLVVAVIPDLTKLKAGGLLEPKAPVSLLEKIGDHLRTKISPFARLKVMNPRYEFVNVCIAVRLYRGKSQNFYAQKLKEDITLFLAPWFLGDSEKLAFGEEVLFSDIVGYIEGLDYVDFIVDLKLEGDCNQTGAIIRPLTARSILTAGEICVDIDEEKCPSPSILINKVN